MIVASIHLPHIDFNSHSLPFKFLLIFHHLYHTSHRSLSRRAFLHLSPSICSLHSSHHPSLSSFFFYRPNPSPSLSHSLTLFQVDWVRYAAIHTMNVAPGPFKVVDWWMSYLNYQVRHQPSIKPLIVIDIRE